jgi:transposase
MAASDLVNLSGTLEKDKPPILGLIERGGPVVLHMLANVQQTTIQPIIGGF